MAGIYETRASLGFFGDELDPAELTAMLGAAPHESATKGSRRVTASGREFTAKTGKWLLRAPPSIPENLAAQIDAILTQLTPDLTVWQGLADRFHARLFCGLFMEGTNEGLRLDAATLSAIAGRGLFLDFDIYAPVIEDRPVEAGASSSPPSPG